MSRPSRRRIVGAWRSAYPWTGWSPAGSLRLVSSAEPPPGPAGGQEGEEVPFTGWLGLLRALYQVVGPPDGR